MNRLLDTLNFVLKHLEDGREVVLLIVAESSGSSPGRPGFTMAVAQHEMFGSIGGGVMEVSLVERARALLESDKTPDSKPIRQVHRKDTQDASGMICSGEQTVILRRLSGQEIGILRKCVSSAETGADDEFVVTESSIEVRPSNHGPLLGFEKDIDGGYSFSQRLLPCNELFIVGGGHCSLALSELMSKMDFRIVLYDDRPELNTIGKNRFAHEINIIEDYTALAELIESRGNRYVVVMTIGYKYDKVVVRELLEKDFKYFGVLGSKAKMAVMLRELKDEGLDAARLDAIRTPIGIDINSRTPAEIAVSIAAEIIAVKNEGN